MAKGTLVIITPPGGVTQQRVETSSGPSLEVLQAAVGGYIERVKVRYDNRVRDAYVNEDGIEKRLAFNRPGTSLTKGTIFEGATLVGNVAIWVPDAKVKKAV